MILEVEREESEGKSLKRWFGSCCFLFCLGGGGYLEES